MPILSKPITITELKEMSAKMFGNLVKVVVDIELKKIAIDAELHADLETELLNSGSKQHNLWGINLHPDHYENENFIEFDSMINIRPNQNNPSRSVLDATARNLITSIIKLQIKVD